MAQDLREIYDPPELVEAIRFADNKSRNKLMKKSTVRRGEQGRGAQEPDVVTPMAWWLELQWAGPDKYRPENKFRQAVQDVEDHAGTSPWKRPVAICQLKGSPKIRAWLKLKDLFEAMRRNAEVPPLIAVDELHPFSDMVVSIDYDKFLEVLRHERDNRSQQ